MEKQKLKKYITISGIIILIIIMVTLFFVFQKSPSTTTTPQTTGQGTTPVTQPSTGGTSTPSTQPTTNALPTPEVTTILPDTEEEIAAISEEYQQKAYQRYPILSYLPYQSEHFKIDAGSKEWKSEDFVFYIRVLYNMSETDRIDEFRQQALDWMRSKGANPDMLDIVWK